MLSQFRDGVSHSNIDELREGFISVSAGVKTPW